MLSVMLASSVLAPAAWGVEGAPRAVSLTFMRAPDAPLRRADMEQALSARLPVRAAGEDAMPLSVRVESQGLVHVEAGGRRITVPLDGASGVVAARLVALVVSDLLSSPAAPVPPLVDPAKGDLAAQAVVPAPALANVQQASRRDRLRLSLQLEASSGHEAMRVAPLVHGLWARGAWGAALDFGYRQDESARRDGVSLQRQEWPLALSVLRHVGARVHVQGGALASYYSFANTAPARGVLWGGTASLTFAPPLWGPFAATVAVGVDAFANAVEARVDDVSALPSARLRPWARVGVAWRQP